MGCTPNRRTALKGRLMHAYPEPRTCTRANLVMCRWSCSKAHSSGAVIVRSLWRGVTQYEPRLKRGLGRPRERGEGLRARGGTGSADRKQRAAKNNNKKNTGNPRRATHAEGGPGTMTDRYVDTDTVMVTCLKKPLMIKGYVGFISLAVLFPK